MEKLSGGSISGTGGPKLELCMGGQMIQHAGGSPGSAEKACFLAGLFRVEPKRLDKSG